MKSFAKAEKIEVRVAEKFFHHYQSVGWTMSKDRPIRNWRSALRKWALMESNFEKNSVSSTVELPEPGTRVNSWKYDRLVEQGVPEEHFKMTVPDSRNRPLYFYFPGD